MRASDGFVFPESDISQINPLLLKIEQIGKNLGRYGFNLERLLAHFDTNTLKLPKFAARIRTGNEEEIRFLADIDAKIGFMKSQDLQFDDPDVSTFSKEIERNGVLFSQRIDINEIFESNEIEKLIKKANELNLDYSFFDNSTENHNYQFISNSDNTSEAESISNLNDYLKKLRTLGRKGLQIQRYKGLGK